MQPNLMSHMTLEQKRHVAYALYGPDSLLTNMHTSSGPAVMRDYYLARASAARLEAAGVSRCVEIRVHVTDARTGEHVGRYPTYAPCASTCSILAALAPFTDAGLVPRSVHCKPEGEMDVHLDFASLESVLDMYVRGWSRWTLRPDVLTVRMHRPAVEADVVGYDSPDDDESFVEVPGVEGLSMTE